jgi:hypothetical protein
MTPLHHRETGQMTMDNRSVMPLACYGYGGAIQPVSLWCRGAIHYPASPPYRPNDQEDNQIVMGKLMGSIKK